MAAQRKSFSEYQELFLQARSVSNHNDMAIWATELLKIDPTLAYIWSNRGDSLLNLGHPLDAILNYSKSLELEEVAGVYNNKGAAYWEMEKCQEALTWYNKALELDPGIPQTHMNIGHVYRWLGENKKAVEAYRQATKVDPKYADAHMGLGILLLKLGQFKEGWEEYEWRWKSDQIVTRGLKKPEWKGEDLAGKSILVYGEQGLGDIIQFSRYARVLVQRYPTCKVIVEGRQQVRRLLETIQGVDVINFGEKFPEVDYGVAMMSLGGILTPSFDQIPPSSHEFVLDPIDVERWKEKLDLAPIPKGFRVGICWAGRARLANKMALKIDVLRSTTLDAFAPLAKIPGVIWASLQKDAPSDQLKTPPTGMTIVDYTEDMYDFYETACVIENCDLVITVDTAVAHVAASIGKETWILGRWDGCWRWHDRERSPWYPSVRYFAQSKPHDWEGLMAKVAVELKKLVRIKDSPELDLTLAK
jgi:tetratricopeptide (TPR) repeat protein